MKFRQMAVAPVAMFGAAVIALAFPTHSASAQADTYERILAGVRLGSRANIVLRYFGNPNDVVVGDVGIRDAPAAGGGTGTQGGTPGFGGGGAPSFGGAPGFGGGTPGGGRRLGGASFGGQSGSPAGYPGASGYPGGPGGGRGGEDDGAPTGGGAPFGGGGAPFGGGAQGGGFGGFGGGASGTTGAGPFGQTVSTLTPQQETTWIYNRKAGKDVVSYEFLIGQGGVVTQIRAIGYAGGNVHTRKGVGLGSTYKEVVQKYGYPQEQYRVGRSLIASYKNSNHVLFQFLNQRGQAENPFSAGNKAIAITIASVE